MCIVHGGTTTTAFLADKLISLPRVFVYYYYTLYCTIRPRPDGKAQFAAYDCRLAGVAGAIQWNERRAGRDRMGEKEKRKLMVFYAYACTHVLYTYTYLYLYWRAEKKRNCLLTSFSFFFIFFILVCDIKIPNRRRAREIERRRDAFISKTDALLSL